MAKKTKKKKKTTTKKGASKAGARGGQHRRRRGGASLAGVSAGELKAELNRRQRQLDKLRERRESLASQIAEVDSEISDLEQIVGRGGGGRGGRVGSSGASATRTAGGGRRKRPKNTMTLEDALAKVLNGKEMGVTEAANAVQKAGYRTSAANFRTIVNQTLLRSDRFKKVSRGLYTAA